MRGVYLGLAFCLAFAADAAACAVERSFFEEGDTETLVGCLRTDQSFLTGRDAEFGTVLHLAVETGKGRVVLDAIRRAAGEEWQTLRDRVDREGRTALHLAAAASDAGTVRWLLKWGADANAMYAVERRWNPAVYSYGVTPLHLAAAQAAGAEVVSALLAGGADPEIRRPPRTEGWTAALIASRHAANPEILIALASGGADLSAVGLDKNNALHVAVAWDRPASVIDFLLESGVDPDGTNADGQTPLHLGARFSSDVDILRLLLDAADDACLADTKGRTASELLKLNASLSGDRDLQRRFHESCVEGR